MVALAEQPTQYCVKGSNPSRLDRYPPFDREELGDTMLFFPALNLRDDPLTPWRRIVVIDNEPAWIHIIARRLGLFDIATVGLTGEEAAFYGTAYLGQLTIEERREVSMILIDNRLHLGDGLYGTDVARYIRSLDGYRYTPIGIFTFPCLTKREREDEMSLPIDQRITAVSAVQISKSTPILKALYQVDPRAREQAQRLDLIT